MRVAFVTRDGVHLEGQLRLAPRLAVYEVTAGGFRLERSHDFEALEPGSGARMRSIEDVSLLYATATGPSVAVRLAARNIQPASAPAGTRLDDLLRALQRRLASAEEPSPGRAAGWH